MAKPPVSIQVVANGTIDASGTAITTPLWTGSYWKKTIYISTAGSIKAYIKASPDGVNFHFLKSGYLGSQGGSTDDGAFEHAINNVATAIECDIHCDYIQIVFDNQGASAITDLTVWISGVGA